MTIGDFLRGRVLRPNPPAYLSEEWCYELGRRLLRPERPRLAEARALTGDLTRQTRDAPAAWERVLAAGLVPAGWADDAARRFVSEPAYQDGDVAALDRLRFQPAPTTVEAVVALASDAAGVLRAEEIGAEATRRASQFCHRRTDAFVWRVLPARSELPQHLDWPHSADGTLAALAPDEVPAWLAQSRRDRAALLEGAREVFPDVAPTAARDGEAREDFPAGRGPIRVLFDVEDVLRGARFWFEATRLGVALDPEATVACVVPRWEDLDEGLFALGGVPYGWQKVRRRTPLTDLLDPFVPLLDILWLGYLPGYTWRGRTVLVAPAPDPARMSARHHRAP